MPNVEFDVEIKRTHFVFQRLKPLSSQSVSELLFAPVPLLHCVFCNCVPLEGAVLPHHAQGGTSSTGHTGEALTARETEHRHQVKAYITLPVC